MSKAQLTDDEIVATLRHSSLTTILVEGTTDMNIYRWIEEDLNNYANIQSCGGRDTLFRVYKRRDEFKNVKVIFLADRDRFVYSSIPIEYSSIIFTKGYSIENDLYHGKQIEVLLTRAEHKYFSLALENFIRYYGCQLEKMASQPDVILDQHPKCVLDVNNSYALRPEMVAGGFFEPSETTKNGLRRDYDLLLRGHSLISLLQVFLSGEKRKDKYSNFEIYECCYKLKKSVAVNELLEKLQNKLKE